MTELSPNARAACDALRADGGSDAEHERVRARLSALGVAMTVGAGSALVVSTASAAAGVAGAGLSASAAGALPSASLASSGASASVATQAGVPALLGGTGLGAKSALVGAAVGKLAAVPLAVKAGIVVVALGSTLAAPELLSTPRPAREPVVEQRVEPPAREREAPARRARAMSPIVAPSAALVVAPEEPRAQIAVPVVTHRRQAGVAVARSAVAQAAHTVESTLAKESALLEQALSALRSGQSDRARELLSRHEEIYGAHALLARERERMRRELSHLLR